MSADLAPLPFVYMRWTCRSRDVYAKVLWVSNKDCEGARPEVKTKH